MDNYSKVLTFFMKNNVQLTNEQIEALQEEFLNETKAHGYAVYKSMKSTVPLNSEQIKEIERFTREIDILNNKLKRKEITQEEFDKKYKEIEARADKSYLINSKKISPNGSKDIDKYLNGRPNKSHADKTNINPKQNSYTNMNTYEYIDKDAKEKIERHFINANSTDNDKETLREKEQIQKQFTNDGNIKDHDIDVSSDNETTIRSYNKTKKEPEKYNKEFYHKSALRNEEEIKPTVKSKEGILYSGPRVYAATDKNASGSRDQYNNVYKLDKSKFNSDQIKKDPDLKLDDSVYIEGDKKIKTKKESAN